jgi:hypothetical protein
VWYPRYDIIKHPDYDSTFYLCLSDLVKMVYITQLFSVTKKKDRNDKNGSMNTLSIGSKKCRPVLSWKRVVTKPVDYIV